MILDFSWTIRHCFVLVLCSISALFILCSFVLLFVLKPYLLGNFQELLTTPMLFRFHEWLLKEVFWFGIYFFYFWRLTYSLRSYWSLYFILYCPHFVNSVKVANKTPMPIVGLEISRYHTLSIHPLHIY